MNHPPPLPKSASPKRKTHLYIIGIVVAAVGIWGYFLISSVMQSGITGGLDNKFGDQHLKTTVALLELHKTRYGRYPDSLSDLKYIGAWDQIALQSVQYFPSHDHASYYVEVERGWMAKPHLTFPPEFWQGTGYSTSLKPTTH